MTEYQTNNSTQSIAVVGVGGCGCSTLQRIYKEGPKEQVQLVAINTDQRSLRSDRYDNAVQIGPSLTSGLGAGAKPDVGRSAAKESENDILNALKSTEIIFLTAGMGGGTGTGASPEVARVAQSLAIPVIAIVTKPFNFEGQQKARYAEEGILKLQQYCKAVIVLPNDRLAKVLGGEFRLVDAFDHSNQLLVDSLKALTTMLSGTGMINIDMSDFKVLFNQPGKAVMGVRKLDTSDTIEDAIADILYAPLLEEADLTKANGAIVHITARETIELGDYHQIGESIQASLNPNAMVIVGLSLQAELSHDFEIMIFATGIPYD
ncbi:cell division protein FtsZ [Neiella marina]|uniref:Cell division protein FtsZ n=1 Tax=Neiella holothuriorum TaxID=2870530 RepID=A0ABS7EC02_9GAMM|nr:cell division protein FtsZ [Neiella holothuriorum]MBW8189765.1 cell division protein FtsZ [Neiella holothuriorum]